MMHWTNAQPEYDKPFGSQLGNAASPAFIGPLSGDLGAGETKALQFQFASNGGGGSVTFTAYFSGGCTGAYP